MLTSREKTEKALCLRRKGWSFRDIGRELGVSYQRAHQLVTAELQRINARCAEEATEVTALELQRLDDLWRVSYGSAMGGSMRAVEACLRIIERRSRILGIEGQGYKLLLEVSGPGGNPIETKVSGGINEFADEYRDVIRQAIFGCGAVDTRVGGESLDTDEADGEAGGVSAES